MRRAGHRPGADLPRPVAGGRVLRSRCGHVPGPGGGRGHGGHGVSRPSRCLHAIAGGVGPANAAGRGASLHRYPQRADSAADECDPALHPRGQPHRSAAGGASGQGDQGRRWGFARDFSWRGGGAGGRVGLRQEHPVAHHSAIDQAHRGPGDVWRHRPHHPLP